MILSASYMLWMIQRVFYGQPSTGVAALSVKDVNWRERAAVWPTIALMIAMGVASVFWMHAIDLTVPGMSPVNAAASSAATSKLSSAPATYASDARGGPMNPSMSSSMAAVSPALRILPEILMTLTGVLVMLVEAVLKPKTSRKPLGIVAILGTLAAIAASVYQLFYPGRYCILRHRTVGCL